MTFLALTRPQAEVYVPDGTDAKDALRRTTHLGIGAHPDDLEFMAWYPIVHCYSKDDAWFTAVTVGDGRGSPREGRYADFTDDQMREVRFEEQRAAARLGRYSALLCLDYPSDLIRNRDNDPLREELLRIVRACRPSSVFTHNLADKHDTHTAVAVAVIESLRQLPPQDRPDRLYGCEVWRSLDWLADSDKSMFDVSDGEPLMERIMAVYASQIAGGKRYDLATIGRKRANATYLTSHEVDRAAALEYALDMTALLRDPMLGTRDFIRKMILDFAADVDRRLTPFT